MLEFYTDEFKERASKQIEDVNQIIKDKLPDLHKWQMRGCFVQGDGFNIIYLPLKNEEKKQIGTEIRIDLEKENEKYVLTSEEESLKLRHEVGENIVEAYFVQLRNDSLFTYITFINNEDFITVDINEINGIKTVKLLTNLDEDMYKDALLDCDDFNMLEYIKSIYYTNKGKQRERK